MKAFTHTHTQIIHTHFRTHTHTHTENMKLGFTSAHNIHFTPYIRIYTMPECNKIIHFFINQKNHFLAHFSSILQ